MNRELLTKSIWMKWAVGSLRETPTRFLLVFFAGLIVRAEQRKGRCDFCGGETVVFLRKEYNGKVYEAMSMCEKSLAHNTFRLSFRDIFFFGGRCN